jgi:hypothetical protein
VLEAQARRESAIGIDLSGLWDEAAEAHLSLYAELLGARGPVRRGAPVSVPAE